MNARLAATFRLPIARQFVAFATVGAVGTVVHYATLIVGVQQLGIDPVPASALGWTFGAVANYLLNYHLTFRSRLAHRHAAPRFATIAAIGLLLNTLLMWVQVDLLSFHYLIAQTLATGAILCFNFVLSRLWAFNESPRGAGAQPVFRYFRGAAVLWLGAVFVATGSAGFVTSVLAWRAARVTEHNAFEAPPTIVDKSLAAANSGTRYLALYRFTANDGTRIEGSQELPLETCDRVARGEPVAVCYLPATLAAAPAARLRVPRWTWPLLGSIAAAIAVLGVLMARPDVRRLQAIRRVQRSGVDARATIVDVAPTYPRLGRAPLWRVRYEFADELGGKHAGNSEPMSKREAAQWSVDDSVAVRFDPQAPHHNFWLGTRAS
jgi:putative flippase GtrA